MEPDACPEGNVPGQGLASDMKAYVGQAITSVDRGSLFEVEPSLSVFLFSESLIYVCCTAMSSCLHSTREI